LPRDFAFKPRYARLLRRYETRQLCRSEADAPPRGPRGSRFALGGRGAARRVGLLVSLRAAAVFLPRVLAAARLAEFGRVAPCVLAPFGRALACVVVCAAKPCARRLRQSRGLTPHNVGQGTRGPCGAADRFFFSPLVPSAERKKRDPDVRARA
jgi:hypothetical protein